MAKIKKLKIRISKDYGSVSARLLLPEDAHSILVLAHGAGAGMDHPFMETLAKELAAKSIATLRYNFLYMENGGAPDRPKKAHPVIKAAVVKALNHTEGLSIFAGGKSFGGRMTSQLAANGELPEIKGIVYYGFPLHATGKPGVERAAHLSDIRIPQLFLQGTRDKLAEIPLIKKVCANLKKAKLVKMEGADHSFKTLKRSGISHEEMIVNLAEETSAFIESIN